jgi:hypothetical protein
MKIMNKKGSEVVWGNLIRYIIIAIFIVVAVALTIIFGPMLIDKLTAFESLF